MSLQRLDTYLAQKLHVSRNRAQFFIENSCVQVNGIIVEKNNFPIHPENDEIYTEIQAINYVARSALKLK